METQAAALARRFELSPARFRQVALGAAAMLLVIVATGATVRLTGSGLGCQHWPGCQPNEVFPARGFHSDVEFSNRVVAFLTIVATLVAWLAARWTPGLPRWVKWLSLFTFLGTLWQAPMGAITVYYHLNPWLVLSHFLLSLVVLTAGVVVVLEAYAFAGGRARPLVPPWARWGSVLFGAATIALVLTGTLATAAGPHPGSVAVRRVGSFQPAVYVHVRAAAVFGVALLVILGYLWRRRRETAGLLHATLGLLVLVLVQMAIGEIQYRTQLPWWLVLAHVTLAAAVWGATVALVYSFFRPVAALAPTRD